MNTVHENTEKSRPGGSGDSDDGYFIYIFIHHNMIERTE